MSDARPPAGERTPAYAGAAARRLSAAPTLAQASDGRDNNVLALRYLAAAGVILFHCYALTDRWIDEPLWRVAPPLNFGALGVQVFFVLSGVLVARSWIERPSLAAYAAARALRIYPALVAATILTIALAGAGSALPWREFLASGATWRYLAGTATGYDALAALPGAYAANPYPHAVNGSLWTLPVELRLYVAVAIAGVLGLLVRPRAWLVASALLVGAALAWPDRVPLDPRGPDTRLAALLFLLGSLATVWRARVVLSVPAAALLVVAVAVDPGGALREGPAFAVALAYVVLVVGWHPALRVPAVHRAPDASYGLYVYAFPIQQTIVRLDRDIGPLALFAATLAATLALAALSWTLIEAPALRLKSRFPPRDDGRP
ncbi:MAG: acyltransferase [Burkholderiales bacterium]|nr:acyltransferase [Burkholderiales bacterium]